MADGYEFYRAAVAGQNPAIDQNAPQFGFYLKTRKSGPSTVVAIYPREGQLTAVDITRDGHMITVPLEPDPNRPNAKTLAEDWPYLAARPVSQEQWEFYKEHKRLPEDIEEEPQPEPEPGDNLAPPHEVLADQIHAAAEQALREIADGIDSKLAVDRAANHRDRMLAYRKQAEDAHRVEKAPHIAAGKEVDERWKPVILEADNTIAFIRNAVTPFLVKQRAAAQAAAPGIEAKPKAGTGKRRTGLRTIKQAHVVDYGQAALALLELGSNDLRNEIQRLADKIIRAGGTLDGCEVTEREQAQ